MSDHSEEDLEFVARLARETLAALYHQFGIEERWKHEGLFLLTSMIAAAREQDRKEIERLRAVLVETASALTWCSGSADFGPGGQAEAGWNKDVRPLLARLREAAEEETSDATKG